MELTLVAGALVLVAGVGYGLFRATRRSRLVNWGLVCASLFALATRDLFRPREQGRVGARTSAATPGRPGEGAASDATDDDERPRPPLLARLRSRFGGWLG